MTKTTNDATVVRGIMGGWAVGIPDDVLVNPTALASTWASLIQRCPSLADTTDPDVIADANLAQAYLLASLVMTGAAGPRVTSSRLGDQATTFANDANENANVAAGWRREAWSLMDTACPVPIAKPFGLGLFGIAHGRRGE